MKARHGYDALEQFVKQVSVHKLLIKKTDCRHANKNKTKQVTVNSLLFSSFVK